MTSPTQITEEPLPSLHGPAIWALLIGIDEYKALRSLRGAVNDAESMRILLRDRYTVPEDHIRMLVNSQAKRATIVSTIQQYLLENPGIRYNDHILIYYSGHGSRMLDPMQPTAGVYRESLAPYDARTQDICDIPDRTIAALLDQLAAAKGDNITLILDCCHAGSMSRGVEAADAPAFRGVDPDDRIPPADLDAEILRVSQWASVERNATSQGWFLSPTHVMLGACRDVELAFERFAPGVALSGSWYGAYSYALIETLNQASPGMTYAQVHERLVPQVKMEYPNQTPQCEGARNRELFSGVHVMSAPMIPITLAADGTVQLGAGFAHGLRKGTELTVYPPAARAVNSERAPLATLRVETVGATSATASVLSGAPSAIPAYAKGVVTRQVYEGAQLHVALLIDPKITRRPEDTAAQRAQSALERLRRIIQGRDLYAIPSLYLTVAEDGSHGIDLFAIANGEYIRIVGPAGDELAQPILYSKAQISLDQAGQEHLDTAFTAALHALENIARYRIVLALDNPESNTSLAGKFTIGLRRYVSGTPVQELAAVEREKDGTFHVTIDPVNEQQNVYVVELRNHSPRSVFAHIFMLSPDYSIVRLYPHFGEEDVIKPGEVAYSGLWKAEERLLLYLPDDWEMSTDYLKVVFTTEATDLSLLEQGGVKVPVPARESVRGGSLHNALALFLQSAVDKAGTRYMRSSGVGDVVDDWTTLTAPIVSQRTDTL